ASEIEVAVSGMGTLHQTGGSVTISVPQKRVDRQTEQSPTAVVDNATHAGRVTIARHVESTGLYRLSNGSLSARELLVGDAGRGAFQQTGGRAQFDSVTVGNAATGTGYVQSDGVGFNVRPSATDVFASAVIVGQNGTGVLQLNGSAASSTIDERLPDAGVPLVVRAAPGGHGVVHGWGKVSLTGPLVLNGKIIADGLGQPQSLDFTSAEAVVNTIDNAPDQSNGWYARGNAILRLPPLLVKGDGAYTFGENDTDPVLDLVNSARLNLKGVTTEGAMLMSLVAPDRFDLPRIDDTEDDVLSAWHLDRGEVRFAAADVSFRFDHVALALRGSDASDLMLWVFNDAQWTAIDPTLLRIDADLSLLSAPIDGMFSYIALTAPGALPTVDLPSRFKSLESVGLEPAGSVEITVVPEPGAAMLIAGLAGMLLTRRRQCPA
ncbi:MAG TPA: PEP-CTERM sorting domain-containing protein, partial [Tepidisphaeraceae bacterium]|nr:PEP-CTERM sorting domain-containing protein [Tepidisphaeraceae bacterium]